MILIYDRIRYLISEESGITNIINHNCPRIYWKTLTFHNVITLIKSVVDKNGKTTTIRYFLKKVHIKINPIRNTFK